MAGSFLVPVKKRKAAPPKAPPKKKNKEDTVDDEIISDGEDGGNVLSGFDNEKRVRMQKEEEDRNDNEDIYEKETADERRARMAREMIQQLGGRMEVDSDGEEQMALSEEDESDPDHDAISHRLHEAALFEAGTLQRNVAGKVDADGVEVVKRLRRAHHKTVTCAAVSNDGSLAFSCGKEGNLETMTKMRVLIDEEASVKPHPLCLAVSYDASLLVVGYDDGFIRCWNVGETKIAARLRAHKSAVNGICFRSGSKMFMSCGEDLLVKVWNGDGLSFIETLFGHQSPVYSVHAMNKERAVSVSSDHTARLWKIEEETQLIFRSSMHSVDTVCNINDELFVTGADDGTLSVWSLSKKKPAASVKHAHGEGHENWISSFLTFSVAAAPFTDMLASGSRDGFIRLWKNEHTKKKITQIAEIPVDGFVNSLSFSKDGSTLVAATGPEPRLGRWDNVKAQPAVVVIKIPISK